MRSHLFKVVCLGLTVIFFYGCISNIEKRRYRKGYHFLHTASVKPKTKETERIKQEEKISSVNMPEKEMTISIVHTTLNETTQYLKPKQANIVSALKKEVVTNVKTISDPVNTNDLEEKNNVSNASQTQKEERASGLWYFLSLLAIPFITLFKSKDLARWAGKNKTKSRLTVALCNVVGLGSSFSLGTLMPLQIEQWMFAIPAALMIGSVAMESKKAKGIKKLRSKNTSVGLFSVASLFGSYALGSSMLPDGGSQFVIHPALGVLLFLLLILTYLAALYLLAAISCNIACAGSEGLAIAVFFGGLFLITFLVVLGVQAVFMKKDVPRDKFVINALIGGLVAVLIVALLLLIASSL